MVFFSLSLCLSVSLCGGINNISLEKLFSDVLVQSIMQHFPRTELQALLTSLLRSSSF